MKRFIFSILCVSIFFIGLGSLVDKAKARFKSDERALTIIAQTRQAIGGDAAIKNIRSMTITGNAAQTLTIDGAARTEQGNLEINFQMPNQFSKMLKIGNGANGETIHSETKVFLMNKDGDAATPMPDGSETGKKIVIVKDGDGKLISGDIEQNEDRGKKIIRRDVTVDANRFRQNELFRTTFALLLSAPEGTDASYTFAGESVVDGSNCDVVLAESGGSSFKLYIDQSSHLPVMMAYQSALPIILKFNKDLKPGEDGKVKNVVISKDGSQSELNNQQVRVFTRKLDAPEATAEYQVKFSDYRTAGGVQLPYKWTQTANGQPDQTVDVSNYEINPTNIADKFKDQNIKIRVNKAQ